MAKIGKHQKKKKEYRVGICFGALDGLHFGHIRLFKKAKEICDKLYAITETDELIKKSKGRPLTSREERVSDLKGIKYLDNVFVRTKGRRYWIKKLKPDVLILGDDWKNKEWAGKKLGILIIYFPYTKEISSTMLKKCMSTLKPKSQTKDTK
jgi:cytidyltransferase-like protein